MNKIALNDLKFRSSTDKLMKNDKNAKLRTSHKQAGNQIAPKRISLNSAVVRPARNKNFTKNNNKIPLKHIEYNLEKEERHSKNEIEHSESSVEWVNSMLKKSISDIIFYYADNGDLQSSSIMLLIFKSKVAIPSSRVSSVVRSYINILQRMRADCLAAEIIKFCQVSDIQNEYGKSSLVKTKCQY